ncbi:hypothetical protein ACIP39_27710 [Streptomyces tibetensis]|uniref:hypothetical protein n=1 Tax=Streptomyces tibetensis TaxID=2382123 RepID=UPI0037FC86C1
MATPGSKILTHLAEQVASGALRSWCSTGELHISLRGPERERTGLLRKVLHARHT